MGLLEGKTALITGAARGIGKQIALLFAKEGCNIAFTDLELNQPTIDTSNELKALGVKVKAYASNAADFDAAHDVVNDVLNEFGRIDILINNAGITRDTLLMRMSEQQWDEVIEVNLKSAFNFTHAVTPVMMRQRSGSIVSLSSVVGLNGNAGQANYAASKAGIIALMKTTAKELGARGIRANAIAPGFILTDMTKALNEDILKQFVSLIPMRRGGEPEEVAKVALFLASDLSSYVSGQVIQVNGAMA
ncbi:MAG: 3-oxoacyl-[Paludibacteraceae bacterium]|nr:3-oxoacyl-[acyl-carrier-protein] reductase [Paludibacteraceae bacterium]MBQ2189575.1 3-oxoacyl-[acyl-carrier-protein] reductase [Paludibacteraceae bacterium]MBQ2520339.1 3-oxoacyl-[acyl-carrier-protein] reductase [Paludibacteraceae bacterium]MBQ4017896.1 3-oxoacyl-[acyl-carrier-protein] reductase [Paludibacteraceae bacterium]MBQ5379346.1 3-oxoacyl-[acyl-carrier-protein] reductase [Paludibacteraceae bacterium]